MTVTCPAVRERAPELALGIVSGSERSELLLHLSGCAPCQAVVDEHAEVADLLLGAAPEVEPPAGFAGRVLRAGSDARRRTKRRLVAAVAVAAAVTAMASVAVVRVVDAGDEGSRVAAPPELRSVAMVGSGGYTVGRVTIAESSPPALLVSVDYTVPDGTYTLELRHGADEDGDELGSFPITGGRGEWAGRARLAHEEGSTLVLLSPSGSTLCEAELPGL